MHTDEAYGPLLTMEQIEQMQRELEEQKRQALLQHERWLECEIVRHRRGLEYAEKRLAKLRANR